MKKNGCDTQEETKKTKEEPIRINKYLSSAGYCSRREADLLIQEGRVLVDGRRAGQGERISPDSLVQVDGKYVKKEERRILLLFYKPRGIVCSTKKQGRDATVTEYVRYPLRVYPVGRLDKESEGLLLLTNQGQLADEILRARNYHEKEYQVTVNRPVTREFLEKMAKGVPILDQVTRPCQVKKTGEHTFSIILTQGLNRQIRRMCQALGYEVTALKRVRIMELTLDGLKSGQYREITKQEYAALIKGLSLDKKEKPRAAFQAKEPLESLYKNGKKDKKSLEKAGKDKKSTGGRYGKFSGKNEGAGQKAGLGGKSLLSGGPGDHEQPGVRPPVRPAKGLGRRDRRRPGK